MSNKADDLTSLPPINVHGHLPCHGYRRRDLTHPGQRNDFPSALLFAFVKRPQARLHPVEHAFIGVSSCGIMPRIPVPIILSKQGWLRRKGLLALRNLGGEIFHLFPFSAEFFCKIESSMPAQRHWKKRARNSESHFFGNTDLPPCRRKKLFTQQQFKEIQATGSMNNQRATPSFPFSGGTAVGVRI